MSVMRSRETSRLGFTCNAAGTLSSGASRSDQLGTLLVEAFITKIFFLVGGGRGCDREIREKMMVHRLSY